LPEILHNKVFASRLEEAFWAKLFTIMPAAVNTVSQKDFFIGAIYVFN
jgi:hypothetical protein